MTDGGREGDTEEGGVMDGATKRSNKKKNPTQTERRGIKRKENRGGEKMR